ncbi:MAG TPA: HdeD family acid-resistance protein, partial [Gammaproteobacteria bacterium]|nr:HdeD family acid-resistance protein [Gammaproteobacteria bacterium]
MVDQGQALERLGLTGQRDLRNNWGGFLALGIALIVVGGIAVGMATATTVVSMLVFGWLLVA